MLAGTMRAVISQRLVRTPSGDGRVAVCEILRMTGRARDMIVDPEQTGRLREVIAEGEYYGMQTFDQALLGHHQAGRVSMEDALRVASSPHDFKLLVAAEGRTATSMEDLMEPGLGDIGAGPETLKRPGGPGASAVIGAPRPPAAPASPLRQASSAPPPRPGVPA
jgi:twitching motility protein PilT